MSIDLPSTDLPNPESPGTRVVKAFNELYGQHPQRVSIAPGRVNLIGEHTDYNDGFVLPVAINFHTAVAASLRPDDQIEATALDEAGSRVCIALGDSLEFDQVAPWSNYLRGIIQQMQQAGHTVPGANLVISGNVPLGAGLSSSAALEVSLLHALTNLAGTKIDALTAAKMGQAAENQFVGCQCGIMDQLISASGVSSGAVLIDCRSLALSPVSLPPDHTLLVVNSNVQRGLVDGEYNLRRQQCEAAADMLGVPALRDAQLSALTDKQSLMEVETYRRARHVISENQRTLDAREALSQGDTRQVFSLMANSHASMRDDFDITIPQIDALVDMIKNEVGIRGGVRMTGGGFGGCVVVLVENELVSRVEQRVITSYPEVAGHAATIIHCTPSAGAFSGLNEKVGRDR